MKTKGQASPVGIFLAVLVAGLIILGLTGQLKIPGLASIGTTTTSVSSGVLSCPDTKATTLTFSVKNMQNTSGDETFDMDIRLLGDAGHQLSGTDTTSGSYSLNCGETYTVKGLSATGANGDSAKFYNVVSGNANVNSDGSLTFQASTGVQTLTVGGKAHGVLEFRAKDIVAGAFAYDSAENANTDYDLDGVNFTSSTNNATRTAVGSGQELHYQVYYRPSVDDNVYGDIAGLWVLVDASSTVWDTPTVKVNGVTYSNAKDKFNADEAKAYTAYEYAYLIPGDLGEVKRTAEGTLDLSMFALSGVDPASDGTGDVQVDFVARGAYASSSNSNLVKIGSVQDDSSQTVIHAIQDTTISIS